MANKIGYVRYDNITQDNLLQVIDDLLKYRYFITEKLLCEITTEDASSLFEYVITIYYSTYSPLEPPIFLLLPQLFNSSYAPLPTDLILTESFKTKDFHKLPFNPVLEIPLFNIKLLKKYQTGCMGGTFDHYHPGHLLFLTVGAALSDFLAIGITHSSMLSHKDNNVCMQSWDIRAENVKDFLVTLKNEIKLDIFELYDAVGKASYEDYEVIILSTEVEKAFEQINCIREKNSLKLLEKFVLCRQGQMKISSTVIRTNFQEKNKGHYEDVKAI